MATLSAAAKDRMARNIAADLIARHRDEVLDGMAFSPADRDDIGARIHWIERRIASRLPL